MPKEKITIVGAGYVGMSLAVLLSQHHEVVVLDINKARVASINSKKSTIKDDLIDEYLNNKKLDLYSTDNSKEAFENSKYIVIATPTDYD
jgi:UDPglucose 6-dehydrogenase